MALLPLHVIKYFVEESEADVVEHYFDENVFVLFCFECEVF